MAQKKEKQSSQDDEHSIPGSISTEAITEQLEMMRYVEKETHDEVVLFLEKVKTEQVFDARLDIWNILTDKNRYWVITCPIALYSQDLFPSYDYALTFHVGLAYRTASSQRSDTVEKAQDQLAIPWRHWEQAVVAFETAEQVEDFQAVGILCRECLLALLKAIVSSEKIPVGQVHPGMNDFIHWSVLIADAITHGSNAAEMCSYLKTTAKAAWQFVIWLTQATTATRFDGNMAIQATEYVLMAYGAALLNHKNGIPDQSSPQ